MNAVVPTLEGSAYFGIVVSGGTKPYTYTWMYVYNGKTGMVAAPLNGNPTLTVAMEGPENYEMEFYCVVTDADGSEVTSKTVKITKS